MASFLIIQLRPEDDTADNEFEAIRHYGQLPLDECERLRLEREPLPVSDFECFDAILVGGSPFDVSTPQDLKSAVQLRVEADFRRLFDQVVAKDLPFLGACSGNGLLGSYCGAPITRRYAEPVGGINVRLTNAGQCDPLLDGFPKQFRVLVGHKEACDILPNGAELLVEGDTCPIQMFRVGRNVYATQFHPEGDGPGFRARILAYKNHGYFAPQDADNLIAAVEAEQTPFAQEILRRFVARYRRVG